MAADYPNAITSLSTTHNAGEAGHVTHHNRLTEEVEAIEAELGTIPKGTFASVKARLDAMLLASDAAVVDTATAPSALGIATPGAGPDAAAVGHVHPMPNYTNLLDVDSTGLADGDVYVYDAVAGKLKPQRAPVGDIITNGEQTMDRDKTQADYLSWGSGTLMLTYFRPRTSRSVSQVSFRTGSTARVALTLFRIGIYSVAANGDLTLVASTVSDTALGAAAATPYTKALSVAYTFTARALYAVGVIQVGTTPANMVGAYSLANLINTQRPRKAAQINGQSDLPASPTDASISTDNAVSLYFFFS